MAKQLKRIRFSQSRNADDGKKLRQAGAVLLTFIVGVSFTLLLFFETRVVRQHDLSSEFEQRVSEMATSLQRNFDLPFETLYTVPKFFESSDFVSRKEFKSFVQPVIKRHSAVYAYNWLPRVTVGEREAFEAKAQATGLPDFRIREVDGSVAAERPVYFPLYYVEPSISTMLGVDIARPTAVDNIVRLACKTRQPVASVVSLIEDPPEILSVAARMPVRLAATSPDAPCDGVVSLLLRIHPVIVKAVGADNMEMFSVSLVDTTPGVAHPTLYKNFPGDTEEAMAKANLTSSREVHFANQTWVLQIAPLSGSPYSTSGMPWMILLSGLVISAMAAAGVSAVATIRKMKTEVEDAVDFGQYKLGRKLGSGGMGTVYEASHQMLTRPAAIKIITSVGMGLASDADSEVALNTIKRFRKEAQATALLESENTIRIYDFGKTSDGSFFYVMEHLRGLDLDNMIKRFGPVSPARCIHILKQVCKSLSEAHAQGMIHRDIKPANIFLCRHGLEFDHVKVLDFGLVMGSVAGEKSVLLTQVGSLLGTPAYMSPEMINGALVDSRSDIYSLGCVAYLMLTGMLVFDAQSPSSMMVMHLSTEVVRPSLQTELRIPADLEALVMQCLEKKPEDRPESALVLAQKLAACEVHGDWGRVEREEWWSRHLPMVQGSSSIFTKTEVDLDLAT